MSSATIAFGLVSIPIKLYTAYESSKTIRFNQIHKKDGARIRQQLVSSTTGEVVPKDEIVKGYEYAKGQYVLFTNEELKAVEAEVTHTIDIQEFIEVAQVPRVFLERMYYLGPDKGGARAYHLLGEALRDTNRAGLGRYVSRGKQYLVLIRPEGPGLCMEQLRYADEIRDIEQVPIDDAKIKPEELELAKQLISQAASEKFAPEQYRDEVRDRIMELIDKKAAGEEISIVPTEAAETKIIDLMAALKASIGEEAKKPAKAARSKKTATKKRTTKKKSG
jgi:DNA end-binding protein Ku